jgi:hypothetical protein
MTNGSDLVNRHRRGMGCRSAAFLAEATVATSGHSGWDIFGPHFSVRKLAAQSASWIAIGWSWHQQITIETEDRSEETRRGRAPIAVQHTVAAGRRGKARRKIKHDQTAYGGLIVVVALNDSLAKGAMCAFIKAD